MTYFVVLVTVIAIYVAYRFRVPLLNKLGITKPEAPNVQNTSQSAQVATPAVVANPATGSDNPWLDAYKQSNPQYADTSGSTNAAVDTSAPELDFAKVGNGVPIPLTETKTIKNCPAQVSVEFNQASGQAGATNTYTGAVNGVPFGPVSITATQKVQAQGPEVKVWVSCPGLQMEIRG